jgi:hypothetical protein
MGVKLDLSLKGKNIISKCLRTGCWGEYLDPKGKWREDGEDSIMGSFILCILHVIYKSDQIRED